MFEKSFIMKCMEQIRIFTLKNIMHAKGKMYTHLCNANDHGMHSHDFVEIIYITSGTITHTCNGETETLVVGDMCVLMPGVSHNFFRSGECTHRDIILDTDFFFSVCTLIHPELTQKIRTLNPSHKYKIPHDAMSEIETILMEYNHYILEDEERGSCLALSATARIIKIILDQKDADDKQSLPIWFWQIIDRFQSLEHIRGGLSMILSGIPYDEIYINRVFKKYYGQSISSYLTDLRLGYAEIALSTTTDTIESITRQYGFSSPTFFFKKFKEKYGVTPNQYRKNKHP